MNQLPILLTVSAVAPSLVSVGTYLSFIEKLDRDPDCAGELAHFVM